MNETNLTVHRKTAELTLAAPVAGLSILENKAVIAWQSPKITDKLAEDRDKTEKGLAAVIAIKLQDAARKSGVSKSITGEEQDLVVKDIIQVLVEFPRLRLGEVSLIFDLGAVGRFGEFEGHSINARTFRSWVIAYEADERNKLIIRQVEAQKAEEEKREEATRQINARIYELVAIESLLAAFEYLVRRRLNEPLGELTWKDLHAEVDLGGIWFKKFKEAGHMDKIEPLTHEQKVAIFNEQIKAVKIDAWGKRRPESEIKAEARAKSENVWFRMALVRLANLDTTAEAFESMLITHGFIRPGWREEFPGLQKGAKVA